MKRAAIALTVISLAAGALGAIALLRPAGDLPCAAGFTRAGPRCCPGDGPHADGRCAPEAASCPAPLVSTARGCDAPLRDVVAIPATSVVVGPADWEAQGRVRPRTLTVPAFAIDRFEVTVGRACASDVFSASALCAGHDAARAAHGVSLDEARRYCRSRGGRLPTDDEWVAAAAGDAPRRYPWGETGAVCRRAAWGLASGPCGEGATGPDTAGAHPDGATPLGVHDLGGNVSEWVEGPCVAAAEGCGVVRGGSWRSALATELRTWASREVPVDRHDPTIGFRCAYDERTLGGPP